MASICGRSRRTCLGFVSFSFVNHSIKQCKKLGKKVYEIRLAHMCVLLLKIVCLVKLLLLNVRVYVYVYV